MSRRNKKNINNQKKNESKILVLNFLLGLLALISFVHSLREYNNFTIISFKLLIFMFFLSGILISSLFYSINTPKKSFSLYDYYAPKVITYGAIFCSIFFLTNDCFSTDKEYIVNSSIFEKHKAYGKSPNYIITEIKGVEREINIHNYSFEELVEFNKIDIKMKNGFWGFQIIKEVKLKK